MRAFSSRGERGPLSGYGVWASLVVASPATEHRLQGAGASVVAAGRLSCPSIRGVFPDQESNLSPCIGWQILNHWTRRQAPFLLLKQRFLMESEPRS